MPDVFNPQCECSLAGFCTRHGVKKTAREVELCRGINCSLKQNERYWNAWEAGIQRGQVNAPTNQSFEGEIRFITSVNNGMESSLIPKAKSCCGGSKDQPHPDLDSSNYGPGYFLKQILASIGIHPTPDCPCVEYAAQMDRWGIEECLERQKEIIQTLKEGQHNWGWVAWMNAARLAMLTGLAFKINPLDPFPGIVKEAIARCKLNSQG